MGWCGGFSTPPQQKPEANAMNTKRAFSSAIAVLLICFACASPAFSQVYSVTSGSWSSGSVWNTGTAPVNNAAAIVTGSNTVTFGAGDSYTGDPTWWAGLGVGGGIEYSPNPGPGTLNITGGTMTTGGMWAGHGGAGTIDLSGGVLNIGGQHMLFGWNYGSSLNVSGGTLNMVGSGNLFNFGHTAASAMNVTGSGVANLSGGISLRNGSQFNVNGGTLNFNNAAVSIANDNSLIVVQGGGVLNMLSGTQTVGTDNGGLWLGNVATTGTMNISGGTWQQNSILRLGVFASGNGIVNQTGGTFEIGGDFEAWGSSPSAYNLQGGTFRTTAAGVQINSYSGGAMTFNITGASGNVTMDTPYDFYAPNASTVNNAAATLTKTGTGQLTIGGQLEIRNGGLSMQAGTLETVNQFLIGTSGGTASGTMTGGLLRTGSLGGSNFAVGYDGGTGSFAQSGGLTDVGSLANVIIGWNAGSVGTYTLTGGTFASSNSAFVGYQGTGTVNVNGGSFSGNVTQLGHSGGAGTLNVGGGSFATQSLTVGGNSAAAGTLNLSGGSFSVASGFTVDAGGTVNINSGGSMSGGASGNVTIQNGGLVKFNGGTGNASMNLFMGSGGTVDTNGQTLASANWANLLASATGAILRNSSASKATIENSNTIWLWDGGQNLTIDTPAAPLEIASWITSYAQATQTGIIKTGTGTLIYSGNTKDYTGLTQVNAGSLFVNNTLSGTGGVTVAAGALLGGSGAIGGTVNVLGTLSPGNSPGVLSIASLVLGGSSTSLFEINGTTRGTNYDGVNIAGTSNSLTYGGILSFSFGSLIGDNTTLDIFNFTGGYLGDYASVVSTGSYAGTWTNNNDGTFKLDQGSQTLTFSQATGDIAVVPEPGALVLAGLGIAAAAARALRRRQK
jgi:autotransporter-associated beta strand protein